MEDMEICDNEPCAMEVPAEKYVCIGCEKVKCRSNVTYVRWSDYNKGSREVRALKCYVMSVMDGPAMICTRCKQNLLKTYPCVKCTALVHRRQVRALGYVYRQPNYWCRACNATSEVTHTCGICAKVSGRTHCKKVCINLHSSVVVCGENCNIEQTYVCRRCDRSLNAVFMCTCCHRHLPMKEVLQLVLEKYDMTEYNVAAALHEKNRAKEGDVEYICKNCDTALSRSSHDGPLMPRYAVARQANGPGEEFLRAIREKPEFVCTCCHRWRFYRSVLRFDITKYNFDKAIVRDALDNNVRYRMNIDVYKGERCPHIHRIPYDIYDTLYDDDMDIDEEVGDGDVNRGNEKNGLSNDKVKGDHTIHNESDVPDSVNEVAQSDGENGCVSRKSYMQEVEYICRTCHKYLVRRKPVMPPMACANNLQLDAIPPELSDLSTLERTIIARRIPFMSIFIMKKYGSHYKIRGGCTNVPTKLDAIATVLPRLSSEVQYHPMKLKRKLTFKSSYMYNWIRRDRVAAALKWLMVHNPLYKDVKENENWWREWVESDLQDLMLDVGDADSVNGSAVEAGVRCEDVESDSDKSIGEDDDVAGDDDRTDQEIQQDRVASQAALWLHGTPSANMLQKLYLEDEVVTCAPGENMRPEYMLMDEHFEELAFPDLFPYGKGGFNSTDVRRTKLNMRQYMQQRILNVDGRFGQLVDYLFCAQYATDIKQLQGNTHVALRLNRGKTLDGQNVTAGMLRNAKELQRLARNEQAWKILKTVRGSPPYWQHELYELLAMLRALGKPTFFITLSAADLHWREMLEATAAQKGKRYSLQDIRKMSIKERNDHLKANPALAAWMFQYRVEAFDNKYLKHSSNPLGKVVDSVFKIEFQQRGSPHVHGLLWIEGAPRIDVETDEVVTAFIDAHISGQMPCEGSNAKYMGRLVAKYQVHFHSKYCRKCHICRFGFPQPICPHTMIAREWDDPDTRKEQAKMAAEVLARVAKAMDEGEESDTICSILQRADVSLEAYSCALAVSHRGNHVILKRNPEDVCVNPYNAGILQYWGANMDLQYVVDEYSTVMYVCSYMMKSEKEMGEVLKSVSRECASDPVRTQLRKIGKAFIGTRVVSAPESAMRLMSLWYIKKTREMRFVDANVKENRVSLPKPAYRLEQMEDDDEDIYMTQIHDRYKKRPDNLEGMCLVDFAMTYEPIYAMRDNSLDGRVDCTDENCGNDETDEVPNKKDNVIALKSDLGMMRKRIKKAVPLLKTYKETTDAEAYYHSRLILYRPWRDESELIGNYETYAESYALQKEAIERNATAYNLHAAKLESAIDRLNADGAPESAWDRFAPGAQEDNMQTSAAETQELTNTDEMDVGERDGYDLNATNEPGSVEKQDRHALSQLYERFARKDRMPYKQYRELMRCLNEKQKQIVMYNRWWCKKFITKFLTGVICDGYKIFLSGAGGTGKSFVIQLILRDVLHLLLPIVKPHPDQPLALLTAPTGTAAFNIDGTTIHSAFSLESRASKKEPTGPPMGGEKKWAAENKLQHLQLLVVDEVSMVGRDTFQEMSTILGAVKNKSDKDWGGVCLLAVGDLMQLDPIGQFAAYRRPNMPSLADLAPTLWDDLMFHELTDAMRQKDKPFRDMLQHVRMKTPTAGSPEDEMLRSREVMCSPGDPEYPYDALHVYARNVHCDAWNDMRLSSLPGELMIYKAIDKTRDAHTRLLNVKFPASASRTGNLREELRLKVGARVMLTTNVDVTDGLTNGAMGVVVHLPPSRREILVEFDNPKVGNVARSGSKYQDFPHAVPIHRKEASFGWKAHKYIRVSRVQFPLMLAWAVTIHKVQGATLPKIAVDMELRKGKFQAGQAYVALSRVRSLEELYIINYDRDQIIVNERASLEMRRPGKELIPPMHVAQILDEKMSQHLRLVYLNVQGLLAKLPDVQGGKEFMVADVVCLAETHLAANHNITANGLGFHSNEYLTFRLDRNIHGGGLMVIARRELLPQRIDNIKAGECEMLIVKISLHTEDIFICCVYRPPKGSVCRWLEALQNALMQFGEGKICLIGDFNENLLEKDVKHLICGTLQAHDLVQHVKNATTDYGSLLDHVYTKHIIDTAILVEVLDCYYSDHDIISCIISSTLDVLPCDHGEKDATATGGEPMIELKWKDCTPQGEFQCNAADVAPGTSTGTLLHQTPIVKRGGNSGGNMISIRKNTFDHVRRKLSFENGNCSPCRKPSGSTLYQQSGIEIASVIPGVPIYFCPLSIQDRRMICLRLGIQLNVRNPVARLKYIGKGHMCTGPPPRGKRVRAIGDGSCLFRSLSFLLIGHQDQHALVRAMICNYIASSENWFRLRPYIRSYGSGLQYLAETHMDSLGTWGTEVELFAFAQLTGRDVIVFAYNRWLVHCSSADTAHRTSSAFYLDNYSLDHFDPVLAVVEQ